MRPIRRAVRHTALLVAATAVAPALFLATPAHAADTTSTSAVVATYSPVDPATVDTMSDDDLRIAVLRILADPDSGKGVTREANAALDGTVDDLRTFLKTGYRLAQAEDDRVAAFRILADKTISPALRAAAEAVIDGTPEELRYFIEVGQYEVDG
ncbi:ALF repeat-containing protein [Streptomyces sp. NBC_00986]|uniref:ALF repeat-containing protein n=1 Tax=Streptomyces sp. NBC_00986 TaxID=2903702 RepID=UPI00386F4939|nr:ALF repeat-containing protein [Streptomyces sp. NBC_00986]